MVGFFIIVLIRLVTAFQAALMAQNRPASIR